MISAASCRILPQVQPKRKRFPPWKRSLDLPLLLCLERRVSAVTFVRSRQLCIRGRFIREKGLRGTHFGLLSPALHMPLVFLTCQQKCSSAGQVARSKAMNNSQFACGRSWRKREGGGALNRLVKVWEKRTLDQVFYGRWGEMFYSCVFMSWAQQKLLKFSQSFVCNIGGKMGQMSCNKCPDTIYALICGLKLFNLTNISFSSSILQLSCLTFK